MNILGITIQFYILRDSSSDVTQVLRSVTYIIVLNIQGAVIFMPASNVEIEVTMSRL
jgi:hypothetical protein